MKTRFLAVVALATLSAAKSSNVDVSKGTDIIPPDSKEALALHDSDKAVKTSPKDNTVAEDLVEGGDTYTKSQPKLDYQKLDVPDTDKLSDNDAKTTDDKKPVVLNDYDPNNIGSSTSSGDKEEDSKDSKIKTSSSSTTETKSTEKTSASVSHSSKQGSSAYNSFTMALSMILFSEVGDKTFLIAALMAMKHPRVTVFSAAFASLIVMSVLSAFLGHALPSILPKKVTSLLAAVLFVVFGVKLMREGLEMKPGVGVEDELEEVEHEIEEKEIAQRDDDLERGYGEKDVKVVSRANSSPSLTSDGLEHDTPLYTRRNTSGQQSAWTQVVEGVSNLASLVLSPIWVQVFVMTFLGEWGDRSQVATIAMAAGSDYWFVILGAIAGHAVCTGAAVVGGKLLATKISMRHVTLAGAVAFLVFAVIYFVEGMSLPW